MYVMLQCLPRYGYSRLETPSSTDVCDVTVFTEEMLQQVEEEQRYPGRPVPRDVMLT